MSVPARPWLLLAALNGLAAVLAGAFGYHWLAVGDSGFRDIFMMGVQYHMWHALALLAVSWLVENQGGRAARLAGGSFAVGIFLFCGSLYGLGLTGNVLVTGAAPAGGVAIMVGWGALAWSAFRRS